MSWRAKLRSVHRDVGYLVVGLTVAYGISGIAVNHIDAWNPNRAIYVDDVALGALEGQRPADLARDAAERLGLSSEEVRNQLLLSERSLQIFLTSGGEIKVDPTTGTGQYRRVEDRPVLRQTNALHLNDLKGVWTYIADAFAVGLIFLALSGSIMMKGAHGISGRGKWLVGAGLLIPILALWFGQY